MAQMGDELDETDEGQQDDGWCFGQESQPGEKTREDPPNGSTWLTQPIESACQRQQSEGRQ